MKTIKELQSTIPQTGQLKWIGLRPERRAPLQEVKTASVVAGIGLEGDHYGKENGNRQVTLIQAEHVHGVAHMLGKEAVHPGELRRNLLISGINLQAMKKSRFQIGEEVILEGTGDCHPCSRMEENLGAGGYQAMRGHGGITARVIRGGEIRLGDRVRLLTEEQ